MENQPVSFSVVSRFHTPSSPKPLTAYLHADNWDDFSYRTTFLLSVADKGGELHEVGGVKIAQFGMGDEKHRPDVPKIFTELDESFFSLGQDDTYYDNLNKLGDDIRNCILTSLRDIVADKKLYDKAIKEEVTSTSLLRFVPVNIIEKQFRRIVAGGERLTSYSFSYRLPHEGRSDGRCEISFNVIPESNIPTNIHVLIGRNGVGKTRILKLMATSLINKNAKETYGAFCSEESEKDVFANLVSVTFSAFDPFESYGLENLRKIPINCYYVGLKRVEKVSDEEIKVVTKTDAELTHEFVACLGLCRSDHRIKRWKRALKLLESDVIFTDADIMALNEIKDTKEYKTKATKIFEGLSSGHKIVLLTITRLIETVAERTLVLLDEPEAHLHPPLLSAFIRTLADLLIDRNGVAIIATHSPVVLQEVPRGCVWKISRVGNSSKAERPEIQTFGENVGVLTREVFGLEVIHSGFHKLIQEAVGRGLSFESLLAHFDGELGAEAKAIAQGLIASRDAGRAA